MDQVDIELNEKVYEFMEITRHDRISTSAQKREKPPPPGSWDLPAEEIFSLTEPGDIEAPETDLLRSMKKRRSRRSFTERPLDIDEISLLLYYTQGIKRELPEEKSLRTVPSAGARHGFETLLYLHRGKDLPRGIYHYRAREHSLALLEEGDFSREMIRAALGQDHVGGAAAVFIWAADARRMAWRYSERAFRYLHLDAGHVCQNLYLAAEAINAGVCAIAAYDDDYINDLLDLNGEDKFVIYMAEVGSRRKMKD